MLKIYDSLTRQKNGFEPLSPKKINMYVCGMTVYDYCHLGHARVLVAFDVIVRYLRARGFEVNYVRNITDIDDKIIQRAQENKEPIETLTARFIEAMHEDERALQVLPPNHEPRATEFIPQMIHLIEKLMAKGYAYLALNGDVYYNVKHFSSYGQLSHQDLEDQQAGARVAINLEKQEAVDFVLWKKAKPGEPSWESPWGAGRPGWHIECSAMAMHFLGDSFDLHGGGADLKFPHHENEIAQSEAATDKPFVKTWMHVGYLQVNREKMSKSLGNFFTIREVLKQYPPEVIRYFLLSSHYRSQLNYSKENLESAYFALQRLYFTVRGLVSEESCDNIDVTHPYFQRFCEAMDDDFNTPQALAVLFEMTHEINSLRQLDGEKARDLAKILKILAGYLGLLQEEAENFLQKGVSGELIEKIEILLAQRESARKAKDWAKADELRQALLHLGIEVEDSPQGTTWRVMT